ncbi:MAG: zinc ribbon domain-containing protein [Verrucomicrobiota bacterium]
MATYVYETIPQKPGQPPVVFEVQQSMKDQALTRHPETGEPVRRVISGGFGFIGAFNRNQPDAAGPQCCAVDGGDRGGHTCGAGCGCG